MSHPYRFMKYCTKAAFICSALLVLTPGATRAATDQVVNDCSNDAELHNDLAAIQAGGGGTLTFNCGAATIILSSPLSSIQANTTIDGGGTITLSGNNAMRIFVVQAGVTLTLNNITITHAYSVDSDGGAITSLGALIIHNSKFLSNKTSASWSGSAIYSQGPLHITNSEFGYNTGGGGAVKPRSAAATTTIASSNFHDNESTASAGGIYGGAMQVFDGASVTISGSTFTNNGAAQMGGAIYLSANSTLTLTTSLVNDNHASVDGGGLYMDSAVTATVSNSTFLHNNVGSNGSGGGIFNGGNLSLTDSTLDGNVAYEGAGLFNYFGTMTVSGTTLTNNHADWFAGGGYNYRGTITVTNSTFSGNTATDNAGFDNVFGSTIMTNVTFGGVTPVAGKNYGISNVGDMPGETITLKNALLAVSTPESTTGNCRTFSNSLTFIQSQGFNLSNDLSCNNSLNTGSDLNAKDPHLGSLANNGGPTLTHMLLPGSPALDNGADCPSTDQRGVTRPQGPACDIGAVERQPNDGLFFLRLPLVVR